MLHSMVLREQHYAYVCQDSDTSVGNQQGAGPVVLMAKPCQLAIWQAPGAAIGVAIASGSLGAGECWRVVSAYATGRGSASGL